MPATMNGTANGHASKKGIVGPSKTAGYKPVDDRWFRRPRDLPPFDWWAIQAMLMEPTIRLGLAMRAAPLMAAEFAYKEGEEWTPGIKCEDEVVGAFVLRQYKTIWQQLDLLLDDQVWGWCAGEITFRLTEQNTVEIDKVLPRQCKDTRLLEKDGKPFGVRVNRIENAPEGHVDLPFPFAFWHAHRPQPGLRYGTSILEGAYSPWADKWLEGGALSVRRKFMFKDSYGGAILYYPEGTTTVGNEIVGNEKIAMEIVSQLEAGGVVTLPSDVDEKGNRKWEIERATSPGNPQHILQFPKDLDTEQLRGMEIPDDVLTAEATGSWAGKTVPMQAFFNGLETWLRCKLRAIKPTVDYLILINFGRKYWYEVTTKPLALQAMEQQGEKKAPDQGAGQPGQSPFGNQPQVQNPQQFNGGQQGGQNQGQQFTQRMGLDPVQAVGEGVMSAAELVKAARTIMAIRMSSEPAEEEEHEFSSTQFNLPGELAFEVRQLGERIPQEDLADDGRELNPHVTVKFGLHTDYADELKAVIAGEEPIAIQIGQASVFSSDEYDVVKLEIESQGLHALNATISEAMKCTDTHPSYKPHVTIAYVKKGLGETWASRLNDLQGKVAVFDRLIFSDKQRRHTAIPLTGKATRFSLDKNKVRRRANSLAK